MNYGNTANLNLRFKECISFSKLETALDKINRIGGERRLDRALNTAARIMGEARPNAYKVVILFAAGKQSPTTNSWHLKYASRMLKKIGAQTYVIAYVHKKDIQEFKLLTHRDDNILTIPSFANTKNIAEKTVNMVMEVSGTLGVFSQS